MLLRSPIQPILQSLLAKRKLPTILQQALAILRRYGTDAHVYLPGVGTLNGLTAGNYLDSAGTTAGTVDQPVGLVLDAAGSVSTLLAVSGVTVGVTGSGSGIAGLSVSAAVVTGRAYRIDYTVTACVGQLSASILGQANGLAQAVNWTGTYSEILTATASATVNVGMLARGAGITSVTGSVTVTEVTGIHAAQGTTAAKPILRRGAVNQLLWSGDFTNAAWVKSGVTATPAQPDPIGGSAAFKLVASSGTSIKQLTNSASTGLGAKTCAIYLKQAEIQFVRITFTDNVSGDFQATLNLATGAFSAQAVSGTWTGHSITATNVNGWWMVVGVGTNATNPLVVIKLNLQTTQGNDNAAGDGTSGIFAFTAALFQGTYTAEQIQALGGIPLTTTAAASTAYGPYWWQFDGSNDSLSLGAPLFQMADDHCVIAGGLLNSTGTVQAVQQVSGTGETIRAGAIQLNNLGFATAIWYDGTNNNSATSLVSSHGVKRVWSARRVGGFGTFREDGLARPPIPLTATGVSTGGAIGCFISGTYPSNGQIYPVIAIKGTIGDSDLLTIERFVGQLSGVTI